MARYDIQPGGICSTTLVLKVALCLLLVCASTTSGARNCSHFQPPMEETLLLFDPLRNNFVNTFTDSTADGHTVFLAGSRRCHRENRERMYPEYQADSLCPGHLVLNHNDKRCPPDIVEVRCNCHRCRNRLFGNCQSVTYPRYVWHFENDSDPGRQVIYNVSVGCQCVLTESES